MTIEEIVRGESKNVEFKAKLPRDSAKYIKTIIAFANSQGGSLVIGVDDVTQNVIGVDDDTAFQIMDSIANAVADSCVPQIVPNIELQTIDQHTDELACIGYEVTDKEIKNLCGDIMRYREEAGLPKRNVTSTQLVNWKLLRNTGTAFLASNA